MSKTTFTTASADIGNTRVKFLVMDCDGSEKILSYPWRVNTEKVFYSAVVQLKSFGISNISAVSVNSEAEKKIKICLEKNGIRFSKVRRILVPPLFSDYDIRKIGLDRLANIHSARFTFKEDNIIVLDSGTALTIEVIKKNRHCGGFILPGERTMIAALHMNTAQLPLLTKIDSCERPGKNTSEAILRGSSLLFRSGIKSILEQLVDDCGGAAVVVTGGNGRTITEIFPNARYFPMLTLRGVLLMGKRKP
jgi:type III pantothenate kinase